MDSLTQITLGAAVGEVVLGKKVGSRAMLWGAIGGTIPDLDVLSNFAADQISALAVHRAITHSFAFAFIAPPILGYLVAKLYQQEDSFLSKSFGLVGVGLLAFVFIGILPMPVDAIDAFKMALAISVGIMLFPLVLWIREKRKMPSPERHAANWKDWSWLFFWAILTHPLLDACTTYGTQLFQPFWDYRVAFNNISVVDPLYTLPFLICVIIASRFGFKNRNRRMVNYLGIALSCGYLLFTFYNKLQVDRVFKNSLEQQALDYERFTTSPTIFNNILWQGVAESDTAFFHGLYAITDDKREIKSFTVIPKNHELIDHWEEERPIKILKWFSNGYYNVLEREDGQLQLNDLRYGSMSMEFEKEEDFVFKFLLDEREGELKVYQIQERPDDASGNLGKMWHRMWHEER